MLGGWLGAALVAGPDDESAEVVAVLWTALECPTPSTGPSTAYSTADLSGRGSYYTGYYPLAVAASPDAFHVANGVRSTGDDIYVYETGGVVPEARIDLTGDVLAPRGLVWSPDSETLYVITQPPVGGAPRLHVIHDPTSDRLAS